MAKTALDRFVDDLLEGRSPQEQSPSPPPQGQTASSWPCSACSKPAKVEEVDSQGRTFWACPHCRASGVTPREPGKPYTSQDRPSPLKELYWKMSEAIPKDFPLVDAWLADHHPALWHEIWELDNELTRLEQEGAEEKVYRAKLGQLLALCQQAQAMRKGSEHEKAKGRSLTVHHCGGTRFWLSVYSDLWICEKCSPPPDDPKAVRRWAAAGEVITEGASLAQ